MQTDPEGTCRCQVFGSDKFRLHVKSCVGVKQGKYSHRKKKREEREKRNRKRENGSGELMICFTVFHRRKFRVVAPRCVSVLGLGSSGPSKILHVQSEVQ